MSSSWTRGTIAAICLSAAVAAGVTTSRGLHGRTFVVTGRSMLPGLAAGDVLAVGGTLDRFRTPRRHERWLIRMPDGTDVVKRVAGLPGERIEIRDGCLVIDGEFIVPPPTLLAETAGDVSGGDWHERVADGLTWKEYRHLVVDPSRERDDPLHRVPGPIYDGLPVDPDERRRLEPTFDVGLAALVRKPTGFERSSAAADHAAAPVSAGSGLVHPQAADVVVRIGPQAAGIRLSGEGLFAVIAGRLARRFVVGAWPVSEHEAGGRRRTPLPPSSPDNWTLTTVASPLETVEQAPLLAVALPHPSRQGPAVQPVAVEDLRVWRAVRLLSAADGTSSWTIPSDCFFVLGDHPSASRDSRQFGPVNAERLVGRVRPEQNGETANAGSPSFW